MSHMLSRDAVAVPPTGGRSTAVPHDGAAGLITDSAPEDPLPGSGHRPAALIDDALAAELIAFRRDMHMHPELANQEVRATAAVKARLEKAGLAPRVLASGTGLICDILPSGRPGEWAGGRPMLALRGDMDALPVPDTKTVPYRSTVPGRAHACGHDVHTAVVLGAGLALARLARGGLLPHPVRLIFQPAEEVMPGGAHSAIDSGALEGVERIVAVHCDPRLDAGRIGLRTGAITSAADMITVVLSGPGGHTARPHLTTDLVTAAARLAVDVPALVQRRADTRWGVNLTWGRLQTGHAANVIPQSAELAGTIRCLELAGWRAAPDLVHTAVDEVAAVYRAKSELRYVRGVPPVVNDAGAVELLRSAMTERFGEQAVTGTEQSLGGEDFSWYLERVPGAMARLGVRTPGRTGRDLDIHQGDFDVDERAVAVGAEFLAAAALRDAAAR
ncbi:amidohydrolase [Streptomyces sp. YIM 98790]|uniref:amidohydrolase n=1 Tax=Streptomyces sp. YIM 98790 TaxID=2689077 RepID=UPI0028BDCCA5|nr:amidohydrolase [Streptomyces sp. YIM 98790]